MPAPEAGPRALETLRLLRRMQGPDIVGAALEVWKRHGDTAFLSLPFGRALCFVNDPDDVMTVLVRQAKKFVKGDALATFKLLMGDGVATSDQKTWVRQRRLVQPSFNRPSLESYAPDIVATVRRHREAWLETASADHQGGGGLPDALDFNHLLPQLAQDIVARTLLGADIGGQLETLQQAWGGAMEFVLRRTNALVKLPLEWPLPRHRTFRDAASAIRDCVDALVAYQINTGTAAPNSFLRRILDQAGDQPPSRDEITTQILNILFAGHETTGNGLASALFLILTHPEVERRLRSEIAAVLGDGAPHYAALSELSYLRRVVYEALRLYPPVAFFVREALEPVALGAGTLRPGTITILSPLILHRQERIWPDPMRFDPDRFEDEAMMWPPNFFAFGAGGRTCLGDVYAVNEMMLVLCDILQNLQLDLDRSAPVEMAFSGTLRPDPLRIRIRPRRSAQSSPAPSEARRLHVSASAPELTIGG